ncbi:hypothetical protein CEY11_18410 [Candidimonas nitroreducens]|uniref:Uncharacterized protein n=1 Tax=Candidimonas nitroreducens TaxID=683354 RepID=A0A225M7Z9_9BURK|nr:hypothetical protein CEY11_18410 [Candidimonas nitroreducens]
MWLRSHVENRTPLRLLVTAKGNHARKNTNLRELDSLRKVLDDEEALVGLDDDGRGFIAPFRAQVVPPHPRRRESRRVSCHMGAYVSCYRRKLAVDSALFTYGRNLTRPRRVRLPHAQ